MILKVNADQLAVIALGGNLPGDHGSVIDALEAAVAAMPQAGLQVQAVSRWWRSAAWPDPAHPPYINGVALVKTGLSPVATLAALQGLEARFGRRRSAANAPRTLDLDLIAHGRAVMDSHALVLPHPRAADRLFVMGPLAEIAPDWTHPVTGQNAEILAKQARIGQDAVPQ
jgi:2-amino-4-hydroxy-6-hydroxymethyldihydropteridine diphosphokinase